MGLLVIMAVLFCTALVWTPFDPNSFDLGHTLASPSLRHWLGTDEFGRDVLSRAMAGERLSVSIAFGTVLVAGMIGTTVGVVCGFSQGWSDRTLMAATDALLAFPGILLALALTLVTGGGAFGLILALGIAYVPTVVRVVRAAVLTVRHQEYVEASLAMGNGPVYTVLRHVIPNIASPVGVLATSMFGWAILAESALSFLGVGVGPPTATWGNMLSEARPYLDTAVWLAITPGAFIAAMLLGVNLVSGGFQAVDQFGAPE